MPKQDFTINTKSGAAGDVYGLAFTNSQRLTFSAEDTQTGYGLAVQQGSKANTCKVGAVSGEVLGVTMRQNIIESAKRPGDGTLVIVPGTPLAVMLDGPINVELKTAITDGNIGINAKGEFGGVGAGFTKATNVKALEYPAAAGDVVAVMVSMTGAVPAAPASGS